MVFMEGTPKVPYGKESKQTVELLQNELHVEFGYFDVRSDATVLSGIQKYSNTQTFPQLYVCVYVCVRVCVCVCIPISI